MIEDEVGDCRRRQVIADARLPNHCSSPKSRASRLTAKPRAPRGFLFPCGDRTASVASGVVRGVVLLWGLVGSVSALE